MRIQSFAFSAACILAVAAAPLGAAVINFEDRPAGPSTFSAAGPAQTLVYNLTGVTSTFTGGVILTNETSQTTDFSNVYATASFGDATLSNALTVTFSQPIHNFQIDILNAIAGNYVMSDNAGNSVHFNLATTGGSLATEGFAATGTIVTIDYTGPGFGSTSFDFAIDNVAYNQPLTANAPEPGTLGLFGAGLLVAAGVCCRRRTLKRTNLS